MLLWIIILALAIVIELITIQLVSIPFMFGSIVALFAAERGVDLVGQIIIFSITSIISLVLFQMFIRPRITPNKTATNLDALIGKEIIVKSFENSRGVGKVNGVEWNIISNDEIEKDSVAIITNQIGTTLVVRKG